MTLINPPTYIQPPPLPLWRRLLWVSALLLIALPGVLMVDTCRSLRRWFSNLCFGELTSALDELRRELRRAWNHKNYCRALWWAEHDGRFEEIPEQIRPAPGEPWR